MRDFLDIFWKYFKVILILFVAIFVATADVLAAAAAKKAQQQKAMQQAVAQQQYQQAVAQRQAQMQQQALVQRQAQMRQMAAQQKAVQEYAAYKKAAQAVIAKRQAQLQMAQQAKQVQQVRAHKQMQEAAQVKQAVVTQQVQQAAANQQVNQVRAAVRQKTQLELNQQVREYSGYLAKRKQSLTAQAAAAQQVQIAKSMVEHQVYQKAMADRNQQVIKAKLAQEAVNKNVGQQMAKEVMSAKAQKEKAQSTAEKGSQDVETVVDIAELWAAIDQESSPWTQIVDQEIKALTVAEYIDRFRKVNVRIKRAPGDYVHLIDAISRQNEALMQMSFMNVLSYVAIVEYDFDNGENKDELARKLLGEGQYQANRKRLGR